MTDEEKKAIEKMKEIKKEYNERKMDSICLGIFCCIFMFEDDALAIDTIINLIEKQAKEIEELKEKNKSMIDPSKARLTYNKGGAMVVLEGFISKKESEQKEKEAYNFGYRNGCNDTSKFNDKTFIRIDKIKAKIEEVEQWELYNMKIPKLSTLDERLGAKIGIKYVLQSLLKKE